LTPQKDYPTLLRAIAKVNAERPVRLIILGDGEDRSRLERLASDLGISNQVDFAGFQSNPFSWMRLCDVYVMSSSWEGLPGVLLEALASGASVISTDCPTGPSEILEQGRWGHLVPVGDADAMAQKIIFTLNETKHVESFSRAEEFAPQKIVSQYLDLFVKISSLDSTDQIL
jgi:glycosyltransferase involved in cell wall biosynthesis